MQDALKEILKGFNARTTAEVIRVREDLLDTRSFIGISRSEFLTADLSNLLEERLGQVEEELTQLRPPAMMTPDQVDQVVADLQAAW